MFSSIQNVHAGLNLRGYITDEVTTTIVYLAGKLNKPILLEGPPGSRKTELAYAVAHAIGTEVERLQCFEGIDYGPSRQNMGKSTWTGTTSAVTGTSGHGFTIFDGTASAFFGR